MNVTLNITGREKVKYRTTVLFYYRLPNKLTLA